MYGAPTGFIMTYEDTLDAIKAMDSQIEVAQFRIPVLAEKVKSEFKNCDLAYKDFVNYMQGDFNSVNVKYSKAIRALEKNPTADNFLVVQNVFQEAIVVREKLNSFDSARHAANDLWTDARTIQNLNEEAIAEFQNRKNQLISYLLLLALISLI